MGFCGQGPMIDVEPQGLLYEHVTVENAASIIDALVGGTAQAQLGDSKQPFFARQFLVVRSNNGRIDPERLEDYQTKRLPGRHLPGRSSGPFEYHRTLRDTKSRSGIWRGTLIHHYKIDENGLIKWVNLIIATGHNSLAMNRSVLQVAQHYVKGSRLQEGMLNRVEAVIRCYDPCLSCSTHQIRSSHFLQPAGIG